MRFPWRGKQEDDSEEISKLKKEVEELKTQRTHRSWLIDALERTVTAQRTCIEQMEKNSVSGVNHDIT